MLGPRIDSVVGFQTGNWLPRTNFVGKKNFFGVSKNFGGMNWRPDKKTILAGIHTTITITIEIDNN